MPLIYKKGPNKNEGPGLFGLIKSFGAKLF